MPDVIKAALTTALELATRASNSEVPQELQYMPPGTHRINASRGGKPVTLEITVDASTADTLNNFLQAQLTKATEGNDDRPFFDFNHEDREAAAWPIEFYWAGDDPLTGGVRAKIEWSGAGEKALKEKTFRRFSPTFIPDEAGNVISSETNMGGLVNRAAFKSIQPLFAKGEILGTQICRSASASSSDPCPSVSISGSKNTSAPSQPSPINPHSSMPNPIQAKLHSLKIIDSFEASDESIATAIEAKFNDLQSRIDALEAEKADAVKARAASLIEAAVNAGRIAPKDEESKTFWQEAIIRDEAKAVKALEALPVNPVLAKVTEGDDPKTGLLDKMQLQQKKLAEVQAAHPQADFQTIFSKAQSEAPDLFR